MAIVIRFGVAHKALPYYGHGIGIRMIEWQLCAKADTYVAALEPFRRTPHFYVTYIKYVINTINVAVNTILGKCNKSFLAY